MTALLDSSGRPIPRGDVARVRMKAMLNVPEGPGAPQGEWGSPWAYDAQAWFSQDFGQWFPAVRSPDAEINADRDRTVARTRDLTRNDGWARGAIDTMADAAVGVVMMPLPEPNFGALQRIDRRLDSVWADEFAAAIEGEWQAWAEGPEKSCDGARMLTVGQMLRLAFVHKVRDGDALAVVLWNEGALDFGSRYATQIQMIDPDRLSNPYEQLDLDRMRGGVEIDVLGAPIAYWIRRAEPNDWFDVANSMLWDRFPRETPWGRPVVVHDCERDRVGQHRGVGVLTSVMGRFKMLSRFDQVSLQRAVLQALLGMFVKSPYDTEMVQSALADGDDGGLGAYQALRSAYTAENPPTLMGGVRIPKLFPGESIETVKSDSSLSEFDVFEHAVLRSVAAATGQTAEEVTRDYSRTNYSSARSAMQSAHKTLLRRRVDFFRGFASPIYAAWLEEAIDRRNGPLPAGAPEFNEWRAAYAQASWIAPARGWVDPLKERQGDVLALDAGFTTLKAVCAEQGLNWRKVIEQRAIEESTMKRMGVRLPVWAGGAGVPATKTTRPQ